MKSLVYLILSYNQLTGPIPKSLGQLGQLFDLELHNNYLTSIPPTLGENMKSLTSLSLGFNKLSGPIAKELASIPNLIALFLENNFLNGSIPEELGGVASLKQLELDHNALTGSIPQSLLDLQHLETLHLGNNKLCGVLPAGFGYNLTRSIVSLDISYNSFDSPLPQSLESLVCSLQNVTNSSVQCLAQKNHFTSQDCRQNPCVSKFCGAC